MINYDKYSIYSQSWGLVGEGSGHSTVSSKHLEVGHEQRENLRQKTTSVCKTILAKTIE